MDQSVDIFLRCFSFSEDDLDLEIEVFDPSTQETTGYRQRCFLNWSICLPLSSATREFHWARRPDWECCLYERRIGLMLTFDCLHSLLEEWKDQRREREWACFEGERNLKLGQSKRKLIWDLIFDGWGLRTLLDRSDLIENQEREEGRAWERKAKWFLVWVSLSNSTLLPFSLSSVVSISVCSVLSCRI